MAMTLSGTSGITFPGGRAQADSAVRQILHVRDVKASGVDGGSSIAGQQTRTLNTVLTNTIAGASLNNNQITLPAGTYWFDGYAPVYGVARHAVYMRNVTDSSYPAALSGPSSYANSPASTPYMGGMAFLRGEITITSEKTFTMEHFTQVAIANNGLGISSSSHGFEVYADLVIVKEPA